LASEDPRQRAIELWELGSAHQMQHEVDQAIALYRESIALYPTAEAHTFLGWAMSWKGDVQGAIAECKKAIEVDPTFGNPYNDIGAYLIELGQHDEAIPWLEKAKLAERYDPKQFPYMNLSRIYMARGKHGLAVAELEAALRVAPGDPNVERALAKLRSLN
jgi:tetratricopeptide (TPR) repeat protein